MMDLYYFFGYMFSCGNVESYDNSVSILKNYNSVLHNTDWKSTNLSHFSASMQFLEDESP